MPRSLPAICGTAHLALCHPEGHQETPILRTTLCPGRNYPDAQDTEIRGYLDGTVKFERNVATQYHVRIGCESSKPDQGRYEVLRVLQRWGLGSIPRSARIHTATLRLTQENISTFPHRHPLLWPVDIYLHGVNKPWGPGRGGIKQDNQSKPEAGDAWWLAARHGELAWQVPGCGFASDTDPGADRGAEPLAVARLESSRDDLVLGGPGLAAHVQRQLEAGQPLSVLLKASDALEARPGSLRAFYSCDFGDDISPLRRPQLDITWSARAIHVESKFYVLQPGSSVVWTPQIPPAPDNGTAVAVALTSTSPGVLEPTIHAPRALSPDGSPLSVRIACDGCPVPAGEILTIPLLETWTPDVVRPQDLPVRFELTSPSGRTLQRLARHVPPFTFVGEFRPDELGLWRYTWQSMPDRRFPPHLGAGYFTVIHNQGEAHRQALRDMVETALLTAAESQSLLDKLRLHYRLTLLVPELQTAQLEAELARVAATLRELG